MAVVGFKREITLFFHIHIIYYWAIHFLFIKKASLQTKTISTVIRCTTLSINKCIIRYNVNSSYLPASTILLS